MRLHVFGLIVAGLVLVGAPASAQVHITIAEGRVTVSAKDATIRQILTEWAHVGQTRIVNLDRLSGAPVSLELTDVPETQALETVLRSVSGYLAAPRDRELPNASRYDRIFLLASSTGTTARPAAPAPPPAPTFAPPPFDDEQAVADEDAPRPPAAPQNPNVPIRAAIAAFPQPQPPPQPSQGAPTFAAPPFGSAPSGVSTPGMVVPTPQPAAAAPRNAVR